jgi:hypothetical protein
MRDLGFEFAYPFGDRPAVDPGLDDVAGTDLLLDALAERADIEFDDPDDPDDLEDQALAALLAEWRDDLRWPPASALVSPEDAVDALRTGIEDRRRARRGLATTGSVAATLLVLSGFGAAVADARPGDALHGLHAMFFDDRRVNDDQVVLSAKAELAKVQQMIAHRQWDQAENQLAEVSSTVQSMNDAGRRQDLINQVNLLNTKVESRDPNATLPPAAPPTPSVPVTSSAEPPTVAGTTSSAPSPSPNESPSPSPTPSSTRQRHQGQTSTPASPAPSTAP